MNKKMFVPIFYFLLILKLNKISNVIIEGTHGTVELLQGTSFTISYKLSLESTETLVEFVINELPYLQNYPVVIAKKNADEDLILMV